jgi:hypothetical protein
LAQPYRPNIPFSRRRNSSRTPIGLDQQHAASFNPAPNRSRAEFAARSVTHDLFEPLSILQTADRRLRGQRCLGGRIAANRNLH